MTKKRNTKPEAVTMMEVCEISPEGDLMAQCCEDNAVSGKQKALVLACSRIKPPLEVGDQFIGRLRRKEEGWSVKPMARTATAESETDITYGILAKRDGRFYLQSSEKNARFVYMVDNVGSAEEGDFVSVTLYGERKFKQVHVIKNYGPFDLNKATAALVLDKYGIPQVFEPEIARELERCPDYDLNCRENLTQVPLVTIDGEDSKDFDDAVWAEKSDKGYHLMVAIADVSFYVRPESALDREAYKRGNSVYLPNMVIPMLPEKLCNDLCSLNPKQKRPSIVALLEIDEEGNLLSYEFRRAVIRSAARLTYREVQEALDGKVSANIAPVFKSVVQPVYAAYQALAKSRKKRGALEIETDEINIKVGRDGQVISVSLAPHYQSMQVVEEFMIAANVAAALALKESKLPVLYRVHDRPSSEKLTEIEPLLHAMGMKLPEAPALKPQHFNNLMQKCCKAGLNSGVSMLVLRLQATAQYSPDNIGHFGLGLSDYVHFTSPIRRYADLLIHRALVRAMNMPEGGGLEDTATRQSFIDIGQHLCETERRAVNAERDMTARFVSSYLQPALGTEFDVKVTGVSPAGMFVQIESMGAEGLIPMSSLPDDFYDLPNGNLEIKGEHSGLNFKLGDRLKARLEEASPITGGLIFKFIDPEDGADYAMKGTRRSRRLAREAVTEEKAAAPAKTKLKKTRKKKASGKASKKEEKAEA